MTLDKFTVFSQLDLNLSEGINIFIGANGTGKTHVMKALYSACAITKTEVPLDKKLMAVFKPNTIGRLVHREQGRGKGSLTVLRKETDGVERKITCEITTLNNVEVKEIKWNSSAVEATFIPVKDMLANAPGFRSLYLNRELAFEEVYVDIIDRAFLPAVKGKASPERNRLMRTLQKAIQGSVINKGEQFYLKSKEGELEFSLLAEGYRKLGLLYLLIQNDTLTKGSVLFWDEPEANLNPNLSRAVVEILLELQAMGVQIFLATHDYVLLKNFELACKPENHLTYHHLFRNPSSQEVEHQAYSSLSDFSETDIDKAYDDLLNREIEQKLQ